MLSAWVLIREAIGRYFRKSDKEAEVSTACGSFALYGFAETDHFANVGKMIDHAKGAQREIADVKLSRYACYLIVMNGDSRKEVIALGQTYFAVKTRQKEISDAASQLSEDEKRLAIRDEVTIRNKFLASSAKTAGVETPVDYAVFQNRGYQGLYNGLGMKDIHKRKGLKKNEQILDHMGATELGGTMPENLPTPKISAQKLKRERKKAFAKK